MVESARCGAAATSTITAAHFSRFEIDRPEKSEDRGRVRARVCVCVRACAARSEARGFFVVIYYSRYASTHTRIQVLRAAYDDILFSP